MKIPIQVTKWKIVPYKCHLTSKSMNPSNRALAEDFEAVYFQHDESGKLNISLLKAILQIQPTQNAITVQKQTSL